MRTGHADSALAVDDLAEHLGAPDHPDSTLVRRVNLGVLSLDGGGDDDGVDTVQVSGIMSDRDADAAADEQVSGRRRAEIATGDRDSPTLEDPLGDAIILIPPMPRPKWIFFMSPKCILDVGVINWIF